MLLVGQRNCLGLFSTRDLSHDFNALKSCSLYTVNALLKCHLSSFAIHNAHKIVHRLERRVPQIREVDEKIGAKLPGTATPQRSGVTHTLFSHPSDYLWGHLT